MNDEQHRKLIARIALQDEAAFRELYADRSRSIFAFSVLQLRDAGRAEEIVVDTLYDVWRKAREFRGDSAVNTWILGIARNHVLMALRTRRRREKPERTDDIDSLSDVLIDGSPSPFAQVSSNERREKLAACLDQLSPEQRESVHMVFFEGMSVQEVAQSTGAPDGTVKTRLFHARRKLRACLSSVFTQDDMAGESPESFGGAHG
jgi:RNA polymerase sigma-70 factor, ECF subfamily